VKFGAEGKLVQERARKIKENKGEIERITSSRTVLIDRSQ